ncbi:hypothetical protein [Priestia abyssalis]|uniref:hypothetical protein n=1 Tax=Priestia abyssalis TaxID=1221450 RepID=UPI000994F4B5|nr:hypothetical protein [Priestia abyssalis]
MCNVTISASEKLIKENKRLRKLNQALEIEIKFLKQAIENNDYEYDELRRYIRQLEEYVKFQTQSVGYGVY